MGQTCFQINHKREAKANICKALRNLSSISTHLCLDGFCVDSGPMTPLPLVLSTISRKATRKKKVCG